MHKFCIRLSPENRFGSFYWRRAHKIFGRGILCQNINPPWEQPPDHLRYLIGKTCKNGTKIQILVFSAAVLSHTPLSFEWMNGTNPTVAFLSDFPNSWICRSIITYLSRGEYFTNWRAGGVKRGSQAAIWGWKSAGPVYAHITAVSPPRPLHLSLLHPPGLGWQIHKYTNTHHCG